MVGDRTREGGNSALCFQFNCAWRGFVLCGGGKKRRGCGRREVCRRFVVGCNLVNGVFMDKKKGR